MTADPDEPNTPTDTPATDATATTGVERATSTRKLAPDPEGERLLAELGVDPNAPPPTSAPVTADEEHITPAQFMRYVLGRHDRTVEDSQLPETLIATFQRAVFADLRAATNAEQAPQVPEEVARVAQGKLPLNDGERDVALVRLGIGAPAAVSVLEELIALGVKRILVVGTGGSLQPALPIGSLAVATGAIREDGASFHYASAGTEVAPDAKLTRALGEAVAALGSDVTFGQMWTTDAPYRELKSKIAAYGALGALAVEMEAAALFALSAFRRTRLALVLAISDELYHEWRPGFHADELRLAQRVAARAALNVAASDA